MKATIKLLKKMAIFIAGSAFLLAGIIMLVTPGPGLVAIIAGLVILSVEFEWAERYLHKAKKKLKETNDKVRRKTNR
ncbi:MAG TPA: PGPGW domain-containing protein [Candidatus Saccharimonadales bacterium]|nr:PGPGW domain-containing protein [Candidatus Saccharimonadales bacterium]